jgi:TolA-binding protein/TolB-like protein
VFSDLYVLHPGAVDRHWRRFSGGSLVLTFVIPLLLIACQKKAETGSPPRYAVLRFENLSGDPALHWTGRAISESLPVSLAGLLDGPVLSSAALNRLSGTFGARPASAPGVSTERAEALAAGANRAITGYIERAGGQLRITATEEDLARGKTLRVISATGSSLMDALDRLAHGFSPQPRPPVTSNAEALKAYATAVESASEPRTQLLEEAVLLDPDFGAAWVALAGAHLARADRTAARNAIERARHRKIDDLNNARLELGDADLKQDKTAIIAATRRVVSLSPGDTILLRSLAETEISAGQFTEAASDWTKLTSMLPNDPFIWNSLGYARSYGGDYTGALAAFQEYQRLRPNEANPFDSIGDLQYSFRKFGDAAASYLQGHAKQPDFEQSGDLYKAAWARFRAGDKTGADALFSQFRTEREKKAPSAGLMELIAADWLYRTGRQPEAIANLRKVAAETKSAPLRMDAYSQLTIWDLIQGDRAEAAKDAAAIGQDIKSSPVFMARFAALSSAPEAEWQARAEKMLPPSMAALRRVAVGYALLLDGKREAALPVWEQIVRTSPATDFFAQAVYARLRGKTVERPILPDPLNLNQFAALPDTL